MTMIHSFLVLSALLANNISAFAPLMMPQKSGRVLLPALSMSAVEENAPKVVEEKDVMPPTPPEVVQTEDNKNITSTASTDDEDSPTASLDKEEDNEEDSPKAAATSEAESEADDKTDDDEIPVVFDLPEDIHISLKDNKEIYHLQKKLKYWKQAMKAREGDYKQYLQQQMIEKDLKPIYVREGKIDHYKPRPIYDKETDRMQTEIWTIKEKIKLCNAKLHEEQRVQQVREETAKRLSENENDIQRLQGELDVSNTKLQMQENFKAKAKILLGQLDQAKKEQERIHNQAENKLQNLQSEYTASIKGLQEKSSQQLSEKEQEIDTLADEIHTLIVQLQNKRRELEDKEVVVNDLEKVVEEKESTVENLAKDVAEKESTVEILCKDVEVLETVLGEKESTLEELHRERASLRALAKQSWRVLKTRLKFRKGKKGKGKGEEEEETEDTTVAVAEKGDTEKLSKDAKESVEEDPTTVTAEVGAE